MPRYGRSRYGYGSLYSGSRYQDSMTLGEHAVTRFDEVPLMDFLAVRATTNPAFEHCRSYDGGSFYGGHTTDALAHDCATFVFPDEIRRMRDEMSEDLPALAESTHRKRTTNQRKGRRIDRMVDAELYRRGESADDRFWGDAHRVSTTALGELTIVVNTAMRGDQRVSEQMWRGACALALTDLLEALGYRVRLLMARYTAFGGHAVQTTVLLKDVGEALSESAAAIIADGGLQRIAWWNYLRGHETFRASSVGGSSNARDLDADIIVPHLLSDESDAREFVSSTVAAMRERAENGSENDDENGE